MPASALCCTTVSRLLVVQLWCGSRFGGLSNGRSGSDIPSDLGFSGGGERIRTADFHVANVALCQLSYTPGVNPG
jgi:hypothetical protein